MRASRRPRTRSASSDHSPGQRTVVIARYRHVQVVLIGGFGTTRQRHLSR
jgi:predicted Rossmann-fold nucleotide-binding protein